MSFTTRTRYKVLDIRECIGDTSKPVVLICKEHGGYKRRRIEVWNTDNNTYETALMLAPGDIILVHETYDGNGQKDHRIDEIEY